MANRGDWNGANINPGAGIPVKYRNDEGKRIGVPVTTTQDPSSFLGVGNRKGPVAPGLTSGQELINSSGS